MNIDNCSDQSDWEIYLQSAIYSQNTSMSEITGDTPFFLT